jgi:hypothetical protein
VPETKEMGEFRWKQEFGNEEEEEIEEAVRYV